MKDVELKRLQEAHESKQPWYHWGPYLSERQWGTVREDYSSGGTAWDFLSHEQARSHTYRWGEDGLMGISDDQQLLCFALALWNGADPILKERIFGLTNSEGNHGEDVKEYYFFLDNTPTHSYMKALYKYPQRAFPYTDLATTNRNRSKLEFEYELMDTGIFAENRYFDVTMEYAKVTPLDLLIRVSATNRGPEAATLHLLPTLWFRNTWAWGYDDRQPQLTAVEPEGKDNVRLVHVQHHDLGEYWLACQGTPELLFTNNESNAQRLWGIENRTPFVKDGINEAVVDGARDKVNPEGTGTKAAAHYTVTIEPGATHTIMLRLSPNRHNDPFAGTAELFSTRIEEANEFYRQVSKGETEDERTVQRQALAGLLWSKQFYCYDVDKWLRGDPGGPQPPERGRNRGWRHLSNQDIILMPDTWEYPWYAAWDLAFHCIAMAIIDSKFAKDQLLLMLHERYMHPNGQLPAYEWAFSDVNPPVHAWVAWRIYTQEKESTGKGDTAFLESIFQKLLLNFTWWVNRKDAEGINVFEGGFLGLDNIGVFDRNITLPEGMVLEQADGTAWMGMFTAVMLAIAMELTRTDPTYEAMAAKLLDHYMYIADAIYGGGESNLGLWDEEDGFFYDKVRMPGGRQIPLKVRSLVGMLPLLAMETFPTEQAEAFVEARMRWFEVNRPYVPRLLARWQDVRRKGERKEYMLLAMVRGSDLQNILKRLFDSEEFFSDYGIRAISRYHAAHPYELKTKYGDFTINYEPAESTTGAFGGNSNWRGPIWFPLNFLLVEALQKYHRFYGDDLLIEVPTGSGNKMTLGQAADEISRRLTRIFLRNEQGRRPVFGGNMTFQNDERWRDYILFHEYFHGDNGAGIGASHQTGWTAVVASLIQDQEARKLQQKQKAAATTSD